MKTIVVLGMALICLAGSAQAADKPACPAKPFSLAKPAPPPAKPVAEAPRKPPVTPAKPKPGCTKKAA